MTHQMINGKRVKVGDIYVHYAAGHNWVVRITGLGESRQAVRKADEWDGVLNGDQHGLNDGDKCWGKVSELVEIL